MSVHIINNLSCDWTKQSSSTGVDKASTKLKGEEELVKDLKGSLGRAIWKPDS